MREQGKDFQSPSGGLTKTAQPGKITTELCTKEASSHMIQGEGGAVLVGKQFCVVLERGHGRQAKAFSGPSIMMLFCNSMCNIVYFEAEKDF